MSQKNISIRHANAEESRLAALRQLALEEPVSRLARLKKTCQRQLVRGDREKIKDLSLFELACLHGCMFRPPDFDSNRENLFLSAALSLALVLEDLRLYSDTAFSALKAAQQRPDEALFRQNFADELEPGTVESNLLLAGQRLSNLLGLSPARAAWLCAGLLATIDWPAALWQGGADEAPGAGENKGQKTSQKVEPGQEPDEALFVVAALADSATGEIQKLPCQTCGSLDVDALYAVAQNIASRMRGKLRPSVIVLVEGMSEVIVLPHFARLMGEPLESLGALVVASGGAQQVARRYINLKNVLNIPLICVFDGDAEESSTLIEECLRDCDRLLCLEAGELEDCYSYEQLLKILGRQLAQNGQTLASSASSIPRQGPRKDALNKLFRSRGLGDFDKIAFARSTVSLACSREDVPAEMSRVIDFVAQTSRQFARPRGK